MLRRGAGTAVISPAHAAVLAPALGAACALKVFYSRAGFDDLRWILDPTVAVLSLVTGTAFEMEPHHGYLNREFFYEVVPSCAGVNFMIVAFCALVMGFLHRRRSVSGKAILLLQSTLLAYVATILANAARIALGIRLHVAGVSWGPFTPECLHHLEGTAVYFLFLCVLFAGADRWLSAGGASDRRSRVVWIPFAVYAAVMVLVPLLHGRGSGEGFLRHALVALSVPLLMTLAWACTRVHRSI
jgi:exosortase K